MARSETDKLVVELEARVRDFEKGMQKAAGTADKQFGRMQRSAKKSAGDLESTMKQAATRVNTAMAGIGKNFAIGVGSGVVAALAPLALFNKTLDTISETASLKRLADRIGMSTTSVQALQYGAVQAGVAVDAMGEGLGDFASKVAEAASGAGPLAQIFKANGVELKKQDGTLRSTRDVLADYANLIKNAQTPAEQLFLAQQAFGNEAAKMLPLFKDGARGLDQLEVNAKSAGAVISKDLVDRAAELDRRFQSMWQTFAVQSKSAILSAIQGMDGFLKQYKDFEARRNAAQLGNLAGSLVPEKGSVITGAGKGARPTGLDARMAGTLATELSAADQKLVDALQKRYGDAAQKATVIPSGGGGGSTGSKGGGVKEKLDYAQKVIESLEREKSLIGASALEIEKSNALWHAGKDATAAQKAEIESLVTAIYMANDAHEKQLETLEEMQGAARDFAGTLVDGLLDGKDAAEVLSNALKQLASRLLNSGLDALFGGGGAGQGFGIIGSLLGLPKFAGGTNYAPGGAALVGERGPEIVNLPRGSQVIPNINKASVGGGVNVPISIQIDAAGADPAALSRVQQQVAILQRDLPATIVTTVRKAKSTRNL